MFAPVRVQEKGQVTLPSEIRRKLNWPKGQLVTFELMEDGVVIKSLDAMAEDLLEGLGDSLAKRGIVLDELMKRSLQKGADAAAVELSISSSEKETLLNALSMRAQAALARIQAEARRNGTSNLTDEEIEAEIQAVRREKRNADRS